MIARSSRFGIVACGARERALGGLWFGAGVEEPLVGLGFWLSHPLVMMGVVSELAERTVDWLETELQGCVAGMGALHARALELIGELSDRKAHVDDGHRHMGDWLVMKFDLARDTAFRWAKVADQLRALPAMSTAYATGELSFDQTRLLAKLATPENEEELLADFGGFSVFSLELWTRKQRERSEKTPTHT